MNDSVPRLDAPSSFTSIDNFPPLHPQPPEIITMSQVKDTSQVPPGSSTTPPFLNIENPSPIDIAENIAPKGQNLQEASNMTFKSVVLGTKEVKMVGIEKGGLIGAIGPERIPYNNGYGDMAFGRLIDRQRDLDTGYEFDVELHSKGSHGVLIRSEKEFKK